MSEVIETKLQLVNQFISPDIDECSADPSPCDKNAECSNADGSYSCTCRTGFTGDGTICQGLFVAPFTSFHLCSVSNFFGFFVRSFIFCHFVYFFVNLPYFATDSNVF